MKLQDPRLEALLEAYREDRRPTRAERDEMWARVQASRRPRRALAGAAVAVALAVAALVLVWLAMRLLPSEAARMRDSASGVAAPFEHVPTPAGGAASAAGGRAATPGEPTPIEELDAPSGDQPTPEVGDPAPMLRASERAAAAPAREAPSSLPAALGDGSVPDAPLDDLSLIEAAEAALRTGDPSHALALLGRHEQRFPSAPTAEERQALRVLALCAAGRQVEGRGARWAFLREHPRSAYRERIDKACSAS